MKIAQQIKDSIAWSAWAYIFSRFRIPSKEGAYTISGFLARRAVSDSHLKKCSELIDYNKGRLIEYSFRISKKHKNLRVALSDGSDFSAEVQGLLEYASREFFKVTRSNFHYLEEYFLERKSTPPRFCIKGNFAHEDGIHYVSIFRDKDVPYNAESNVTTNSGFLHCIKTGQPYVNNDIPSDVLKGIYQNPRISYERVRKVLSESLSSRRSALESNWRDLWPDASRADEAYQSTMIVPLAVVNNDLSEEFLHEYGAKDSERLIFGFLCMDHQESNYFENMDLEMSQIIADLLSIYAYNFFNYTIFSKTFKRALHAEQLPRDAILDLIRQYSKDDSLRSSSGDVGRATSNNALLKLNI